MILNQMWNASSLFGARIRSFYLWWKTNVLVIIRYCGIGHKWYKAWIGGLSSGLRAVSRREGGTQVLKSPGGGGGGYLPHVLEATVKRTAKAVTVTSRDEEW